MSTKELSIKFDIVHIEETQFSSFDNALDIDTAIEQQIGFGFGVDIEQNTIAVSIDFILRKENLPLLKESITCYFKIDKDDFNKQLNQGSSIVLPCGIGKHLAMITIGTARGVLFANTKNTPFNQFSLGLVNVDQMFEKDIVIAF